MRETLAGLWMVGGGAERHLLTRLDLSSEIACAVMLAALIASILYAVRSGVEVTRQIAAAAVGGAVGLGWIATYAISQVSFDVVPISSVTFTGPSADTLMGLVNAGPADEIWCGAGAGRVRWWGTNGVGVAGGQD